MKKIQPEGPYNIGGFSSGGIVAFEMARQLKLRHHDKVSNFIILDGCISARNIEKVQKDIVQNLRHHINQEFGSAKFKVITFLNFFWNSFFWEKNLFTITPYQNHKTEFGWNFRPNFRSIFEPNSAGFV